MAKGLPRSNARAGAAASSIVKQAIDVSTTINVADGAPGFGTVVIGDFPQGNILLLGAVSYLQFSTSDADVTATFDGDYSVGTVPTADNDVADAGEANVIGSTALGAATAKLSPVVRGVIGTTAVLLDNTDGSLELNLNLLIDDAAISGAAAFTVTGALHVAYVVLGDD